MRDRIRMMMMIKMMLTTIDEFDTTHQDNDDVKDIHDTWET